MILGIFKIKLLLNDFYIFNLISKYIIIMIEEIPKLYGCISSIKKPCCGCTDLKNVNNTDIMLIPI
jgi:hypothetical protein